jgi:hypothetical protein
MLRCRAWSHSFDKIDAAGRSTLEPSLLESAVERFDGSSLRFTKLCGFSDILKRMRIRDANDSLKRVKRVQEGG